VESSTLTRGTRSSVMGQDHLWLLTPDIGSVATNVPGRPIFLRDKDSGLRRISVERPIVVKMVVRPIAKLSE
jgi:hypothetical protein